MPAPTVLRLPVRVAFKAAALSLVAGGMVGTTTMVGIASQPRTGQQPGQALAASGPATVDLQQLLREATNQRLADRPPPQVVTSPLAVPLPVRTPPAGSNAMAALPQPRSQLGIPAIVLDAYRRAEASMAASDPGCGLHWWLLAGIGQIESGHAAGGRVDADGTTRGRILGPRLDGSTPGTAVVRDTDHGVLDGDPTYDRAVGPMQFLPGTWKAYGADGNGDGRADPNNVYDASLGAAHYLCAGGADLRTTKGLASAVLRYNYSNSYLTSVLSWGLSYRDGVTAGPMASGSVPVAALPGTGTRPASPGWTTRPPSPTSSAPASSSPDRSPTGRTSTGSSPTGSSTGSEPTSTTTGTRTPSAGPTVTTTAGPTGSATGPGTGPTTSPTSSPTTAPGGGPTTGPTSQPTTSPTSQSTSDTTSPTSGPTSGPTSASPTSPSTSSSSPAAATGELGGMVWWDANDDGALDAGERAAEGVVVTLLTPAGLPVTDAHGDAVTVKTSPSGRYLFTDVPAGSYRVRVVAPSGQAFSTAPTTGAPGQVQSGVDGAGLSGEVVVKAGESAASADAGLRAAGP